MKKAKFDDLPQHIAIIMDGNGRWAKKHTMGRIRGHKKGVQAVRATVKASLQLGIKYLTLFAFSMENWSRPEEEVKSLMTLLEEYLDKETNKLHEQGIRLTTIGDLGLINDKIRDKIERAIKLTKNNDKLNVNIAISYGSRDEIVQAAKSIIHAVEEKKIRAEDINKDVFNRYLYTAEMPDPDLLIRTGGEFRVSNFMLWQIAYTELYFTGVLWPDFNKEHLLKAIASYRRRERRFGLTSEQIKIS